jgi:hypothetical protein
MSTEADRTVKTKSAYDLAFEKLRQNPVYKEAERRGHVGISRCSCHPEGYKG